MADMMKDKVVLVTGAGSGLGRAAALRFAAEGARVALSDIDGEAATAAAASITAAGGDALGIATDISSADSVDAMFAQLRSRWGALDIAINNAGISVPGAPMAEIPESDFDRLMGVNLKGVWLCMRRELPLMLERGGGVIVNVASALGLVAIPNSSAYVAAKHGVIGLSKAAAIEYATAGIRVNALCPGVIETPLMKDALADAQRAPQLLALHPLGRFGQPADVVEAMLWLASPASAFVTGIALPVDGGWTAQ